ncbi:hypothetical protein I8752_13225 [Nostocaceae cyanobacterium CENA369]|uniref:Uncharacterized protein n=1 Tax=Dendronalium phyllosphericum CENA369 TaxID=1725256 RepID=A0A8J7I6E1_9NOST|nr:hypothetical protein [Dendronalium phyllosphericum]MBH8573966.1 hypothetical protein [Dendronalium phyllosphericum CENA369]
MKQASGQGVAQRVSGVGKKSRKLKTSAKINKLLRHYTPHPLSPHPLILMNIGFADNKRAIRLWVKKELGN